MTFRPGPLRAAAALAAGFVVVRVLYRVLFHGADGAGAVLVALPQLRLAPPFAHVVLLGPVTAEGLWDAVSSAFPIAATILAFGVLNALIDLPRMLRRGARRGPLSGIARAMAIAWATLPSLADAARSVRLAQRLRGERGGVIGGARMLAPLLQRTLERAGHVAAALELRGFAGRGASGECLAPVEADDLEVGFAGTRLRVGTLALRTGTLTLLSGPTGSGKSTVLRAIAGLHAHTDGGWMSGTLRVAGHDREALPPRDLAQVVGVVLQHPREAFVTDRVRDEIGLALELRGVARVIAQARVNEIAERVGVTDLLDRSTRGLSAGQATLVAIAAALVEHPILLLVDEPLADLDAQARHRVATLLSALAREAGICVVVAEHRVDALEPLADLRLTIADGAVVAGSAGATNSPARPPRGIPEGRVALLAAAVTVRHGDLVAVREAGLAVGAGEIVALVGPNGAGKSSLLGALALPSRGMLVEAPGRVALVPDASDDLFTADTVAAECARADRRARQGGTVERFAAFLGLDPAGPACAERLARHPLDLSVGERRCLAIALQLATRPAVLLVDEPTRGLDPAARETVAAALTTLADGGAAVLVASHEPDVAALASRVLTMRAGVLSDDPESAYTARSMPDAARGVSRDSRPVELDPTASDLPERTAAALSARPAEPATGVGGTGGGPRRSRGRERGQGPSQGRTARARQGIAVPALTAANLVALAAFCWPLLATALPQQAEAAVPVVAFALAPLAALVVVATLDGTVRSAHMLALLGTLAAIGAAVRIAGTGVGGVEAVFILLILAGRVLGPRFALLLGMTTIALSSLLWGAIGPWTPFQMFACAWVGAGAGILPRLRSRAAEIALLCVYGVVASYLFGLLMNLWFWPFAVGPATGISYQPGAPLGTNLASFLVYSLVTSTVGWDTLRAITTVIGLLAIGRPVLTALRRAKPLRPGMPRPRASAPARESPTRRFAPR